MVEGNEVFPPGGSAALVVIEFPSFRDFIDAYSPIISEDGIFIRNADISESNAFSVGDQVDFEVRLKDDFRLIQGAGEVVWLGVSEAADGASGTAIRFHDVDEPSQRLISRLVGNYVKDGGTLFEVGGEVTEGVAEESSMEESELFVAPLDESAEFPGLPDNQELTAETLRASEAETLFALDSEVERTAPLEFESVSVPETPGFGADDPVGLETIAIPSGLVAKLASEAAQTREAGAALESDANSDQDDDADVEDSTDVVSDSDDPPAHSDAPMDIDIPTGAIADVELGGNDETVGESGPEQIDSPPLGDDPPGADSVLDSAEDAVSAVTPDHFEVPLSDDFDDASLAAAGGAMDDNLGVGGAFPEGIAEVAEELSGVHRIEIPEPEEASGVTYAGSASARPERNTGGRIAALAVVAVLLGTGAFYFQDSIRGFLGLGGVEDGAEPTDLVRAGETMPPTGEVPAGDATSAGDEGRDGLEPDGEVGAVGAEDFAGASDAAAPATGEAESAATTSSSGNSAAAQGRAEPAASVTAARAEPPAAAADERRVERITWREEGDSTIVTIRLNTELSKAYLEVVRVREGVPRQVIKIQGVTVPYSPSEVAIGSSHLLGLRTGLHRVDGGSVLHVVADLADAGVTIVSVEPNGRDLEITFS